MKGIEVHLPQILILYIKLIFYQPNIYGFTSQNVQARTHRYIYDDTRQNIILITFIPSQYYIEYE